MLFLVSRSQGDIRFQCTYVRDKISAIGDVYRSWARVLIDGDTSINDLEKVIEGKHLSGKTNYDVDYLSIIGFLPIIPRKITDFFPNLTGLAFYNTSLKSISAGDLEPFTKLLVLYAYRNKLVTIDGDLFKHTPWIRWIGFSENQIQRVGSDLIKNLHSLEEIYFLFNPCVNTSAETRSEILRLNDELPILCPMKKPEKLKAHQRGKRKSQRVEL